MLRTKRNPPRNKKMQLPILKGNTLRQDRNQIDVTPIFINKIMRELSAVPPARKRENKMESRFSCGHLRALVFLLLSSTPSQRCERGRAEEGRENEVRFCRVNFRPLKQTVGKNWRPHQHVH